jgi:hypothetical protein
MALVMGPVLSFRGHDTTTQSWNLTALVVADAAPGDLSVAIAGTAAVKPEALWKVGKLTAYRYTFSLPVQAQASSATYKVLNKSYDVAVPAARESPNMAYASCNGFSSFKLMKGVKDPNALWKAMAAKHGLPLPPPASSAPEIPWPRVEKPAPYHLLLFGGDQVYADAMWEIDGPMKKWLALGWDEGNAAPAPPEMRRWLDRYYFELYADRWAQPEVREILARIPTVAMWDDHDLMDGWGSYPVARQTSAVFGAIWQSASKAFAVFQQHLKDGELRPGAIGAARPGTQLPISTGAFSFGYVVGAIAIMAIDMRSQRTEKQWVVTEQHWTEIYAWIDALPEGLSHLLVMSSILVVYPGFDTIENLLGLFPGHQDLEDDLRDHWNSPPHRAERLRMIRRLLGVKGARPLIVSGDVHVAALGVVESSRPQDPQHAVNQLISSGIVHPGPGAIVLLALRNLFDSDQEIERGVVGRMMKFPNTPHKFVGGRNFLSLEPDIDRARPRIWANWMIENQEFPITKVIEPNEPASLTRA